ncbi:hypothetical protein N9599_03715 [Candidatus Pelagibacter sp.]|nr:hypothetical protein [Candidatus Pelagibacter sp.]
MEDHPQRDYVAAKLELPNVLSLMRLPKEKKDTKTFGDLTKNFLKSGFSGFRLMDKSDKHEYKQTTIDKYTKLINTYILLKGSSKVRDRMSNMIEYDGRVSDKPFKDYTIKEIDQWHIECVQTRMKDTKTTAK